MAGLRARLAARLAVLGAATMGLSACYYDAGVGLGYYDDGYGYNAYDCDPYSPFDSYYDCDYRGGFYNFGFGGGWYQDYWYPGHGFYIFDRLGHRHHMHDHHRRYWGQRRHEWYRLHHGRRGDGRGWSHNEGERRYGDGRGWHDGERRDGYRDSDRRRDDGTGRRDRWRGGDQGGQYGTNPNPAIGSTDGQSWRRRGEVRRGEGRSEGRRSWQGTGGNALPAPAPVIGQPDGGAPNPGNWRRNRGPGTDGGTPSPRTDGGNRGNWQPPVQQAPQSAPPPAAAPRPQGRAERILRGETRSPRGADRPQRLED
jgi:hypothetical protein